MLSTNSEKLNAFLLKLLTTATTSEQFSFFQWPLQYLEKHVLLRCKWANHDCNVISYHNYLQKKAENKQIND